MNIKSMFNNHPGLASNPNRGFDEFRQQLMLTMARKLAGAGGSFEIPVSEVDEDGQYMMTMEVDQIRRVFKFKVTKKS